MPREHAEGEEGTNQGVESARTKASRAREKTKKKETKAHRARAEDEEGRNEGVARVVRSVIARARLFSATSNRPTDRRDATRARRSEDDGGRSAPVSRMIDAPFTTIPARQDVTPRSPRGDICDNSPFPLSHRRRQEGDRLEPPYARHVVIARDLERRWAPSSRPPRAARRRRWPRARCRCATRGPRRPS